MVKEEYPNVKRVLTILGLGTFLAASIFIPTLPMAAKPILDIFEKRQREKDLKMWNKFNQSRLKQTLKRLYDQKVVEIIEKDGESVLKLTDKGRAKYFSYKLEEMMIEKPPKWDGNWRLIIYDVKKERRFAADSFRRLLKKMEIFKLQRSVYLTPYACDKQIEFLRQYFGIGEEVLYLEVHRLENEEVYRRYFGV